MHQIFTMPDVDGKDPDSLVQQVADGVGNILSSLAENPKLAAIVVILLILAGVKKAVDGLSTSGIVIVFLILIALVFAFSAMN